MNNDTTHNDTEITEITDEMREIAWYAFQEDQGFSGMLDVAENAVDVAARNVARRALMQHPAMIRAYCASAHDEWAVSHEEWRDLWARFKALAQHHDDAVASYIDTMPAVPSAPAPQPNNEGGHWVVEIKGHCSEEWEERYEGTLDMCRAFFAGAALGLDEDIIRIARPARSVSTVGELIDALASLPRDTPLRLTSGADAVLHEALTAGGMVLEVGE